MNIDKVFLCYIYKLEDVTYDSLNSNVDPKEGFNLDAFLHIRRRTRYVKRALVYYSKLHKRYIDLETGTKYKSGCSTCAIGELYINNNETIIPYSEVVGRSSGDNISKRKIRKEFRKVKKGEL